jgi:hypothetical protein
MSKPAQFCIPFALAGLLCLGGTPAAISCGFHPAMTCSSIACTPAPSRWRWLCAVPRTMASSMPPPWRHRARAPRFTATRCAACRNSEGSLPRHPPPRNCRRAFPWASWRAAYGAATQSLAVSCTSTSTPMGRRAHRRAGVDGSARRQTIGRPCPGGWPDPDRWERE